MTKQVFLARLRRGLSGLPQEDIEERLTFYSEMIDDRMEEGFSEEDAVFEIGNIDELIAQIVAEIPLTKLVKEKITPKKRLKVWEIVLLVLGCPIWISLLIAAVAVLFSIYVVLWSVVVSLWAVVASLAGCAVGGILASLVVACGDNELTGIALIGAAVICAGLAIILFFGCKGVTKGILILTKKFVLWIKSCFMNKEVA